MVVMLKDTEDIEEAQRGMNRNIREEIRGGCKKDKLNMTNYLLDFLIIFKEQQIYFNIKAIYHC